MNYYNEIKQQLINNEVYKKVKDYSKNRSDLETYYKVGKLLVEAGRNYGESILKIYSNKLIKEIGKQYNERTLRRIRQFYYLFKKVNWSHHYEFLPINIYLDLTPKFGKEEVSENKGIRK